jgi:preprotein translocase subunit SecD
MRSLRLAVTLLALAAFVCGCKPRLEHGVEFIVSVGTNSFTPIGSNQMHRVADTLGKRIDKLGRPWSAEQLGDNRISVRFDPRDAEEIEEARMMLKRGGVLEFRLVHEDNQKLLEEGLIPVGSELFKETRRLPDGQKTIVPFIVSRRAIPGLDGRSISRAGVGHDAFNRPEILFQLDSAGALAFEGVTTTNVGRHLAIILDGELYSAPRIRTPISGGNASLTGEFTEQEARRLAVMLEHPLEMPVQILEEKRF